MEECLVSQLPGRLAPSVHAPLQLHLRPLPGSRLPKAAVRTH